MTRQKTGGGCLSIFGLLTLATAGGAYIYFNGLPWEQFTPTEAARVIPEEAIATGYINTEPQAWSKLSEFGTPEAQNLVRQRLEQLQQSSSPKIDYQQDIQPWLEDVSFALLPRAQNQPQVLFVLGIRNKFKAAAYAKKLKEQANQTITETPYQGFKILQTTSSDSQPMYSAVVGKYLLYSDDRSVIEQAINTQKGEPSYLDKPNIKELLSQKLSLKNSLFKIYIDDYRQTINRLSPDPEIPIDTLKTIQLKTIVLGLGVEDTGLHLQSVAQFNSTLNSNLQPQSSKLLSYFPQNTLMLMNGQGIKEGWSNFTKESEQIPNLQALVEQIRETTQMANLNADRDVFSWMDQEFAIGLAASDQPTFGIGLGGIILWRTSDRPTAENTLNKLNQLPVFGSIMEVKTTQLDGRQITEWKTRSDQKVLLSYGWLDDQALAMTVALPFQTVLNNQSNLTQSQDFQEITASLPEKNFGYFYLDFEQSFNKALTASNELKTFLNADSRAILESIKGLAATTTQLQPTVSQFDLVLSLKHNPQVSDSK